MALRLTLRTLLAYLDDTLQAAEIKEIGPKVTESDAAQELIARIKQVTRRRRLTVPPATGPNGMDPNDVAEYLDNVLPGEQIAEVEKHALESDVHLAEIAATHQILTLVLGEPALVPPKARERMYTLIPGREAVAPARKAAPARIEAAGAEEEHSLALSMGWLRWMLPVAGLLLLAALGLAVYQVLPYRRSEPAVSNQRNSPVEEVDGTKGEVKDPDKGKGKGKEPEKPPIEKKGDDGKGGADEVPADEKRPIVEVERSQPPAKGRVAAGRFVDTNDPKLPYGVVTRRDDRRPWDTLKPGAAVFTSDAYTALPGFVGLLNTANDVDVLLRGSVREFSVARVMDTLMESAVVLHPSDRFDLDLTLLRGRVFLTNRKKTGPCKIRLRFEAEVWDLELDNRDDRVMVNLTRNYTPVIDYRLGEAPQAHCFLALLRGSGKLKTNAYETHTIEAEPRKWVLVEYDSFGKTRAPATQDGIGPLLKPLPPEPEILPEFRREGLQRMKAALKDLQTLMAGRKPVIALQETLERPDPVLRVLAVYCLQAIDEVGKLVDVLGDGDVAHAPDREAAFFALQRWLSRGPAQAKILFDEKTGGGVLIDKKFKKIEARRVLTLLHPLLAEDTRKPETFQDLATDLEHTRVAIAEMAYLQLFWLAASGGVKLPPNFNAAAPADFREQYTAEILKMIDKKALPPMPPQARPEQTPPKKGP